jgi:DNA-binding transcriptional LysR family regulator
VHIETLKAFRDLVDTGSFSQAAQLNLVSQSAVSQQLKTLEARFDCVLLERGAGRRVRPTDAGRLFYAACADILERWRAVEARLREQSSVLGGTVRIATVYSVGLHQLPPYVTRFMQAHPQVKVDIEYSRTNKVCEGCAADVLDFGILALPVRQAKLTVIPWREERLVLVCAPQHAFARRRRVRLRELQGAPFIAFERDIPTRRTIDRILRAQRVAVHVTMEFDNVETIKRSVEVGGAVSILPETTVVNETRSGLLVAIDLADGPFTRSVGIVHRRGRVLSAAAREFVRVLNPAGPPAR